MTITTNNQQGDQNMDNQNQNQNQNHLQAHNLNQQEKKNWEIAATFKSDDGAIEVRVNVLRISRPLYSIQIGGADGSRFLRVQVSGLGKIVVQHIDTEALTLMLVQAMAWIQNDRQIREDELISARLERETKAAEHGKPKHKTTGKTEKTREKRRGGKQE